MRSIQKTLTGRSAESYINTHDNVGSVRREGPIPLLGVCIPPIRNHGPKFQCNRLILVWLQIFQQSVFNPYSIGFDSKFPSRRKPRSRQIKGVIARI